MNPVTEKSLAEMGYTPTQIPLALDLQDRLRSVSDNDLFNLHGLFRRLLENPETYAEHHVMLPLISARRGA